MKSFDFILKDLTGYHVVVLLTLRKRKIPSCNFLETKKVLQLVDICYWLHIYQESLVSLFESVRASTVGDEPISLPLQSLNEFPATVSFSFL